MCVDMSLFRIQIVVFLFVGVFMEGVDGASKLPIGFTITATELFGI